MMVAGENAKFWMATLAAATGAPVGAAAVPDMFGIPDMLGMVVPPAAASPPVVEAAEVAAGAAAAEPPDPPPQAASTGSVSETAAAASRQPCPRELEEHRIVYSPFRSVVTDLCPGSTFSARGPRLWSRL